MSSASRPTPDGRVVRPRWYWRVLFAHVLLLGVFLYISLASLGGYLFMLGFADEHSQSQRLMALGGGGVIMLVCLWLLKVAMPRRVSPVLVEREPG